MRTRTYRSGFTLAELMAASVIGAFIALGAVSVMRTVSASREKLDDYTTAADQLRFASDMLRDDLANIYRDPNETGLTLVGAVTESAAGQDSILLLRTVNAIKARYDEPEGDVYEVEYHLAREDDRSVLLRRLWPNPDDESVGGGVVTEVAEKVAAFEIIYFDGKQWLDEWPEDSETLLELVQIDIAVELAGQGAVVRKQIFVNFPRMPQSGMASQAGEGGQGGQGR